MKIPSFDECIKITEQSECFTHRIREVDGFKISIFDYLLATYPDFKKNDAFELRGLCFVHNPDESKTRYLMLHKFFNLNQCADYQYEDVKNKKVVQVMDKLDGSVIRFIKLPNGKVIPKSKTFFDNNQTNMAKNVYDSTPNLKAFIDESIELGLAGIFELTSNLNRIVLYYPETNLTLLQLRDEQTGEYLDIYNHPLVKKHGIKIVEKENYDSIDTLIELKSTIVKKEGWIVRLEDNQFLKIKGDEYCRIHGIVTDALTKEDIILEMILNETIDDALAELPENDNRKPMIEDLTSKINHYIIHNVNEIIALANTYDGDRKAFALKNFNNKLFPYASGLLNKIKEENIQEEALKRFKTELRKRVYRLEQARTFLKEELNFKLLIENFDEN